MKIGVYTNLQRDINASATKAFIELLLSKNIDVFLSHDLRFLALDLPYLNNAELAKASDILVVFGGDGTILHIAKECAIHDTHILAVNLGYLGFLTEVENGELHTALTEILNNNYNLEERALLDITHNGITYKALNEAVIERGKRTKLIKTEVCSDGTLVDRYSSDGLIISTPTGSTAYSMSAGGPILSPNVSALIIVAICPHSLRSRPLVVSDCQKINIKLLSSNKEAHLNIDGQFVAYMNEGESVVIKKSPLKAKFIRLKTYNYYEKLWEKMSGWVN